MKNIFEDFLVFRNIFRTFEMNLKDSGT